MKLVKGILLFFVISLCLILQCEVYQHYLWNFERAEYVVSKYEVSDKEMKDFLTEFVRVADENNVSVFSTYMVKESNYKLTLLIYGNTEEIRDSLNSKMKLSETTYTSLFSGITSVEFHDFYELADASDYNDCIISYIGNADDIESAYEILSESYSLTYPDYWEVDENDLVVILWSIVAVFLIILNCVEVIRRKKEVVIRRSLGEGAGEIIAASVIGDLILYILVYIIARLFVFHFVSGEYGALPALVIYAVGCMASFLPYISYVVFDVRKAFSNVGESSTVLWLLYALKFAATGLVIFIISTNLSSIKWNGNANILADDEYRDNSYLALQQIHYSDSGAKLWDDLYENEYDTLRPVICLNILDDSRDYIFVNEYAYGMLDDFADLFEQADDDADLVIFLPKSSHTSELKETALEALGMFVDESSAKLEDLNIQYVTYTGSRSIVYMNSDGIYGTEKTRNPVLIYKNSDAVCISGSSIMNYGANDVFFGITDEELREIETKYASYFEDVRLVQTNVYDAYSYRNSFITRLISFLSSLCVVTLILDIAIILSVNKMEYRRGAMEHSLKRVLGYGLYERNKGMLQRSVGLDLIAALFVCVAGMISTEVNVGVALAVGAAVTAIEVLVICQSMLRIEKENVPKVLKGGCL